MKFTEKSNSLEVEFEQTDTWVEKNIALQGLALIKSILQRIREIQNPNNPERS